MSGTVVYTAVTGGRDASRPSRFPLVYYTDYPALTSEGGVKVRQIRPSPTREGESRNGKPGWLSATRVARWFSTNSHLAIPEAEISVYHDGTHRLVVPPEEFAAEVLGDADIAAPAHPWRDCVYDEAARVLELKFDTPELVSLQMMRYRVEKHPEHWGLWELTVNVRRHTPEVVEFNEMWWDEIRRGSYRDQLSFPVVARRLGLRVASISARDVERMFDRVDHVRDRA